MVSSAATDKGEHQNIVRTGLVLGALAAAGDAGLKLTDAAMRDEEIEAVVATQRRARATRSTTRSCAE